MMAAEVVALMLLAVGQTDPDDAGESLGRAHVATDAPLDEQDAPLVVVPAVLVGVQGPAGEGGQLRDALLDGGQAEILKYRVDAADVLDGHVFPALDQAPASMKQTSL